MKYILATLRTAAVLVSLWAALGIAAWALGAVPLGEAELAAEIDPARDDAPADQPDRQHPSAAGEEAEGAGVGEHGVGEHDDAAAAEEASAAPVAKRAARRGATASALSAPASPSAPRAEPRDRAQPAPRLAVCPWPLSAPSVSVVQLVGDARPELVVGCADRWEVLAPVGSVATPSAARDRGPRIPGGRAAGQAEAVAANARALVGYQRVLALTQASLSQARPRRARFGAAAGGDLDADGRVDLVLPLSYESETGESQAGRLYWLRRSPLGGFAPPTSLAPVAAYHVALAPVDERAGIDAAVLHRKDAERQLPSEVWVFSGGPSPTRRARVTIDRDGRQVAILDVDRDGRQDLAALSRARLDLLLADASGGYPRRRTFVVDGGLALHVADLDADGGMDVLVVTRAGLRFFAGGPLEEIVPRALSGLPAGLRDIRAQDFDADGVVDVVGWAHPHFVRLRQRAPLQFEREVGFTLVGDAFAPLQLQVVDLDGDGAPDDVLMLGGEQPEVREPSAGEGAGPARTAPRAVELVYVLDAAGAEEVRPGRARAVQDAPLVLRAELPSG